LEPKKKGGGGGTLKAVRFNQEELRKMLVEFIIMDELSFKFRGGEELRCIPKL